MCYKPCFFKTVLAPQRGWSHLLACKVNRLGGVRHDHVCLSLVFKSVLNSIFITVAGSGSMPKRKPCIGPILYKERKPVPEDLATRCVLGRLGFFVVANSKKVSLTLSEKYSTQRQQLFTVSD